MQARFFINEKVAKKYQTAVSDEIESKMVSMFGLGMSYRNIANHVQEFYGIEVFTEANQWKQRLLHSHCQIV